jgi:murein DD-endopeptidase MepM/ murein hydrolase activator NlpD
MSKNWPVPHSYSRTLPKPGEHGSFWENRGDRYHAGVDIYAPIASEVFAVESGKVIEIQEFTSPDLIAYWNITYSVLVETDQGLIIRYAEIDRPAVQPDENIQSNQLIGYIGLVLNTVKIDETAPKYIQDLKEAGYPSMLHFEVHAGLPLVESHYLGGNFFTREKPDSLIDPSRYLNSSENQIS